MSQLRLSKKISLITGAAQGIGLATAVKFAQEGAYVVLTDVQHDLVQEAVKQCKQSAAPTAEVLGLTLDVTDRANVDEVVKTVRQHWGRIDVLVNNAGIIRDARLQKMTQQQFDEVVDVDLKGVFHCSQAVANIMVEQGSGVILNASSIVGIYGNFGQTNYAASKFGVIGFTKTWSRELGPKGVRVNAVAPGFISTPMVAQMPEKILGQMTDKVSLRRLGKPEEVAAVYAFLASDEASYINGTVLEVAGGLTI